MCGLVGQAGALEYADEGIHKRLLLLDYWRGPDSTGMASIRKNGDVHIAKVASHPLTLFDMKKFSTAMSGSSSLALIGHNRLATKGKVNDSNAHPFQYDHIVGAHNGTLDYSAFRRLQDELGEEFDVDSQAIFAGIARLGLKETISLLTGAWSLVFVDTNKGTLNWLRNKERPLWFAYSEDFKKVYWASEYEFIDAALMTTSNSTKLHVEKLKDDKGKCTGQISRFWKTAENIHYSFDLLELAEGKKKPKPRAAEIRGKEPDPVVTTYGCGDPFGRNGTSGHGTPHTPAGTAALTMSYRGKHDPTVVQLLGIPSDPYANAVSREKFEEMASLGCSWCGQTIEYGDVGIVMFERDQVLLCKDCGHVDEDATRIYLPSLEGLK